MNPSTGKPAAESQKHRKRVITSARKEQNRIAQRLYRKRQRNRLQKRENHHQDLLGNVNQLKPLQLRGTLQLATESLPTTSVVGADMQLRNTESYVASDVGLEMDQSVFVGPGCLIHGPAPVSDFDQDETLPLPMISGFSFPGTNLETPISSLGSSFPHGFVINCDAPVSAQLCEPNFTDVPDLTEVLQPMFDCTHIPDLMDATALSHHAPELELLGTQPANNLPKLLNQGQDSENFRPNYSLGGVLGDYENISIYGSLDHVPGLEDLISAVARFLLDGCSTSVTSRSIPSFPLSNPYINYLQTSQSATFLGYLHNARCIGLELRDLISLRESPFYHPNTSTTTDPQALLAAARKPSIPAHLQPTLPQILIQHHPYLDLLPFPALRSRAIMLAASVPKFFDPMELKRDIFREGLYCHRQSRGMQPWDSQSWEAAPWFLKKWRLLVG